MFISCNLRIYFYDYLYKGTQKFTDETIQMVLTSNILYFSITHHSNKKL